MADPIIITDTPAFFNSPLYKRIVRKAYLSSISSVIGNSLPDNIPVRIHDPERQSGLYILGQPRTGKSWLMVNMMIQDIENGHGIFRGCN